MYEPSTNATRYVREHLAARFMHDRMTREALNECDDLHPGDLMIVAVYVCCVDIAELLDLILAGERATCDNERPSDIWDGRNDDIRDYVNNFYQSS